MVNQEKYRQGSQVVNGQSGRNVDREVRLVQWSSSSPPTTVTWVRSWARTWAMIGWSQSYSKVFSLEWTIISHYITQSFSSWMVGHYELGRERVKNCLFCNHLPTEGVWPLTGIRNWKACCCRWCKLLKPQLFAMWPFCCEEASCIIYDISFMLQSRMLLGWACCVTAGDVNSTALPHVINWVSRGPYPPQFCSGLTLAGNGIIDWWAMLEPLWI